MDLKKELIRGNIAFQNTIKSDSFLQSQNKSLFENGQHPYSLIIACSDSRVAPEIIFNTWLGELFVIRTAGNVINEGELATIEYATEHLHIKTIIVLGHTKCGAIHAAIHNEKGQYLDPILSKIKLAIKDECDEYQASVINAKEQVRYIKDKFPNYEGEALPMIYDIKTNKVSEIK